MNTSLTRGDTNKQRIDYIDCAKGIGIILVIIGHTVTNDSYPIHQAIRGGIFSFHMPMFFILSTMTYKLAVDREQWVRKTEKAFRHLILPGLLTYVVVIFIMLMKAGDNLDWREFLVQRINAMVYASGVKVNAAGAEVPALGMLWFLVVLFVSRSAYDYCNLKIDNSRALLIVLCLCSIGGVLISRIMWLPLSFDIVLAIMPFLFIGTRLKEMDIEKKIYERGFASAIIWAITLYITWRLKHTYMELATRRFPLFPLCFMTAIAGTMAMVYLCKWMMNHARCSALQWLGRNSMIVYCVHAIDNELPWLYYRLGSNAIDAVIRIAIDIIASLIIVKTPELVKARKKSIAI